MKKKHLIILLIVLAGETVVDGQKIITLKECYERAYATAPILAEKDIYNNIWQIKNKNLSKGWLPVLEANGSFLYSSSVIDMNDVIGVLPVPGIADFIKPLPHEQYKITLDITQMIYDGGSTKSARALEKADMKINEEQNETDLYKLRGQVNSYYFNIMLLERQKELLQNYLELINRKISSFLSAVESGVINKSDIYVLSSEKIKLEQQLAENGIRKTYLLKVLSDLTGSEMDTATQFVIPEAKEELTDDLNRPELKIFDLRKEHLDASFQLIQSKCIPKAFGFATLGYGNPPGSNFFRDEFAPYYIVGAGVKWNIFDWNKAKNEKQIVTFQQNLIEKRKTDLTDNLKRMLDIKRAEILSLETLLRTDSDLIDLRKRITAAAESQYENGTITATEYLNELNSENQARINYEIHKINLAMARIEFLNISGKDIK